MSLSRDAQTLSVLVVDDDKYGLSFLRSSLRVEGYDVHTATDAASARVQLIEGGIGRFAVLVTDYRMPGESGMDLLRWVREFDESLGTIIVTAEGEKGIVKEALDLGAVGFLEKPVTHRQLVDAVKKGVEHTRRHRKYHHHEEELAAVGRFDEFLNSQVGSDLEAHLDLYYRPIQEIGGDFLTVRQSAPGRFVILAGDVSGHNVTAGYVSSYFQGLARAGLEAGRPVEESLQLFNRILCEEWGPAAAKRGELLTSLAVVAMEIDTTERAWRTTVAGSPPPILIDARGFTRRMTEGGFPLGWMANSLKTPEEGVLAKGETILFFSDGLTEWADELEIDPLSLCYSLLVRQGRGEEVDRPPLDDVFLARFKPDLSMSATEQFQPLIHESYAGNEVDEIDQMEAVWRRSLVFAFGKELEDRVFDLLICLREAVLNALIHGCERSAGKVATLDVSYRKSDERVRVRVDDPGRGHRFDLAAHLAGMPRSDGRQLGLGMIQHLSDDFEIRNSGTSIVFDFLLGDESGVE